MAGTFLSLHPYYEGGDILGRKQANRGFINALFRRDPFESYHFFVPDPEDLLTFWQNMPDAKPLLERNALKAFPRTSLEKYLKTVPYTVCHFSGPMTEFSALCHARNAFAPHIFPVTAINHSVNYVEHAEKMLAHIWPGCTPRDGMGCSSRASLAIVQARYEHSRLAYNLPQTWRQPQVKIIPLGVPNPELGENEDLRTALRARLQLDADTTMLLYFGRIQQVDKMDLRPLFCALRRLRVQDPQCKILLFIAGAMQEDSPTKEELLNLAKAWDIQLAIAANPSHTLKKQIFAAADVFVSPSDNIQEAFGLTLVEAAQAGLPAIVSDWDGYKDIVVHGETGFRVPTLAPAKTEKLDTLARILRNGHHQLLRSQQTAINIGKLQEAIAQLVGDIPLRKRMGEAAKKRAAQLYTFDAVVEQWLTFWQELAQAPISKEEEESIRAAKHPFALNFGEAFACYASGHLQDNHGLQCTDLGQAFLEGKSTWNVFSLMALKIENDLVRIILQKSQKTCHFKSLLNALQQMQKDAYDEENCIMHILWLLKQDLLEVVEVE